jgi:NAD-dependent SIR2 family protein deacetylase
MGSHNTPFAEMVFSDQIPKCRSCEGLVKPDIVFFGESLPARFFGCVAVGTIVPIHHRTTHGTHAHDTYL